MLKIGRINYVNNLPLFAAFLSGQISMPFQLVQDTPTTLNRMLNNGALDISLVSSYELLSNQDRYFMLPNLGIAARDRAMSVILCVKSVLSFNNCRTIGVTEESATSVQLLKLLCKYFWRCDPQFIVFSNVDDAHEFDAHLLIGDQALLHSSTRSWTSIDLAAAWYHFTGTGLPFGVFAVRKEVYERFPQETSTFFSQLLQAREWSLTHSKELLDFSETTSAFSRPLLDEYFQTLRYELEEPEIKGLQLFSKYSDIPFSVQYLPQQALNVR